MKTTCKSQLLDYLANGEMASATYNVLLQCGKTSKYKEDKPHTKILR